MPTVLPTDAEISDCAMGCRALAHIALEDAKRQQGSSSEQAFLAIAERHSQLADLSGAGERTTGIIGRSASELPIAHSTIPPQIRSARFVGRKIKLLM
jgi:hypothetical protein